jgi:exodeoxyribonuclease VII large subunit
MLIALRGRDREHLWLRAAHAVRRRLTSTARRLEAADRRLERRDVRRVAADLGARLATADARLRAIMTARRLAAGSRAAALGGRLDALSPLGVLARGYAVCWNGERTRIVRDAATLAPGDQVRVTLARGELRCDVRERTIVSSNAEDG